MKIVIAKKLMLTNKSISNLCGFDFIYNVFDERYPYSNPCEYLDEYLINSGLMEICDIYFLFKMNFHAELISKVKSNGFPFNKKKRY
ncbi:hypothetical protein B4903_23215 [Yersinia frederiksenii]|nr:hypothetical protein B4903_23215 [Yersinia frederiksenii]